MKLIEGTGNILIVGAKRGDSVLITTLSGKIEKIMLNNVSRYGIEGFDLNLTNQPLTFYPFSTILKVKKFNDLE